MTGRLAGVVAIITGGGGAIGSAQARLFASEGAAVCIADLSQAKADAVVSDIGERAVSVQLNVTEAVEWERAVSDTERVFGPVSVLCNNAGANFRVSFDGQTKEQWDTIIDTGLTGAFLGIKAVVPSMRRAGKGVILNVGSLAAIRPAGGSPGYAAQKMGMVGLTRSAAASYAPDNIRCVIISPGHVDTPFIRGKERYSPNDWSTSIDNPENYKRRLKNTPLGRLVTPEDVAQAFLFAASDEASMITGSMITVDGGAAM